MNNEFIFRTENSEKMSEYLSIARKLFLDFKIDTFKHTLFPSFQVYELRLTFFEHIRNNHEEMKRIIELFKTSAQCITPEDLMTEIAQENGEYE